MTELDDFGNVGKFNYYPIRATTWMPSMLVEQAFMSNPADEAKMLDPTFRSEMMRAVVLGTEDWLSRLRAQPSPAAADVSRRKLHWPNPLPSPRAVAVRWDSWVWVRQAPIGCGMLRG